MLVCRSAQRTKFSPVLATKASTSEVLRLETRFSTAAMRILLHAVLFVQLFQLVLAGPPSEMMVPIHSKVAS
jgi:hypothetical protein